MCSALPRSLARAARAVGCATAAAGGSARRSRLDSAVAAMTDPGARAVLLSMATFANETGAFVIAEGIEDVEMLDSLRRLEHDLTISRPRVHGGQGYGLGRPDHMIPTTANDLLLDALPA